MLTFGWKKALGVVLTVGVLGQLSPISTASAANSPFSDIEQSYAKQQINDLYQRGIVSGKGAGLYDPIAPITREEFVSMLGRTIGLQPLPSTVSSFTDVSTSSWSYPWIQAGNSVGIVGGVSANQFAPAAQISREEAATLLVRAMESNYTAASSSAATIHVPFADASDASGWAKPYVYDADRFGLMHGDDDGEFRPREPITREETAIVLARILSRVVPVSSVPSGEEQVQLGWQFGETDQSFLQKVEASGTINTLSPRWFFLQEDDSVAHAGADKSMVEWAHQRGKKVWPLVGNHFNQQLSHLYLSQPAQRQKLVSDLIGYAQQYGVDGLNIDFEGLIGSDRADFTAFIQELSSAAHVQGLKISVDLPPNFHTEISAAYDYAVLAQSADYLVLMGYDEHWNGSPRAGSVSSLPWLKKGIDSFLAAMPATKVIVGLPLYTRDWYSASSGKTLSQELTLPQQTTRLANASYIWDASVGQYVATYQQKGLTHTVWVEDARSLALKYSIALDRGVAGVAYWRIGGETVDVWTSLQNVWRYKKVSSL
ncbi:S-layer homology domain-containing protein [Tumebacillus permanentifrigoris]|uniref:Spore germination protein YaaH n=1 Tax=Tumebacillus permanentifrigoris TaxID=378543 RepID=A0A316D9R5_9BACL|nr:S-layer homology domain-containing protein [Tumebacillus permanentifrigoris]PWK12844.1 spore germination protein YaaH [Tumebacillus permanentifrigoris]